MADLFVANCTKQHQIICFRLPESDRVHRRTVRAGGQEHVMRNAALTDVQAAVRQIEIYGAVPAHEIPRAKAFVGMAYSLDKPVSVDRIMRADEHNRVVLDQWGRELRKVAAIGNAAINEKAAQEAGTHVLVHDQEFIEQASRGERAEDKMAERYRVSDGAAPAPSGRRRRAA